jgi:hypothetical protein
MYIYVYINIYINKVWFPLHIICFKHAKYREYTQYSSYNISNSFEDKILSKVERMHSAMVDFPGDFSII